MTTASVTTAPGDVLVLTAPDGEGWVHFGPEGRISHVEGDFHAAG